MSRGYMKILHKKTDMVAVTKAWQGSGETVCLVPTMGNIHRGHLALIERARKTAARVVVSIYVNPRQFGTNEDFDSYPRTLDADCAVIAAEGGCDVIYAPTGIYDAAHATNIIPSGVALPMEGEARPHFFIGVATVVSKLFSHIPADFAIFGEKDFQQLAVIRQMVRDLDINIEILAHPTIRDADGLALSSRNQYLTTAQRRLAPKIYSQMQHTIALINNGTDINAAIYQAKDQLQKAGFSKIDYFDLRQPDDFQLCDKPAPTSRVFVAIWLGSNRLIDNCAIG
ncbi:pantoate--beta-alanine ligase [Candidatus Puniceispirillum sp.]|nr:pantoate--beta-alanine ligase [Candidatus Puniceispirillum sp.]